MNDDWCEFCVDERPCECDAQAEADRIRREGPGLVAERLDGVARASVQTVDATNPPHYRDRNPQPIDVIEGWSLNFNRGSAVKYIARAPYKANELEDLKKAAWHLNREIARLESFGESGAASARAVPQRVEAMPPASSNVLT